MTTPPRTAWLDAGAGVAGDMLLGALLDAGADRDRVVDAIRAVEPHLDVRVEHTERHQIGAVKATVVDTRTGAAADAPPGHHHDHDHGHPHRSWRDVRALLAAAGLEPAVHDRAAGAFARLARAEAMVHQTTPDEVTFHEVGALDAIGEVVGVAAAMADLGLTGFGCSPVTVGSGEQVLGRHGRIPIPGPAVVHLLSEAGAIVVGGPVTMEMTTPTGAALVAEYAREFGPAAPMVLTGTGIGAGTRNSPRLANLTRILIGTPPTRSASPLDRVPVEDVAVEDAVVLAANVDDLDPRLWPEVLSTLMAAGASDAWLTPILMKKGRPAHTLSVLAEPELAARLLEIVVTETSTIGIRTSPCHKVVLDRRTHSVDVDGHPVSVKVARWGDRVVNAQPEYADVAATAAATGLPIKIIMARAVAAAAGLYRSGER